MILTKQKHLEKFFLAFYGKTMKDKVFVTDKDNQGVFGYVFDKDFELNTKVLSTISYSLSGIRTVHCTTWNNIMFEKYKEITKEEFLQLEINNYENTKKV